MQHPSIAALIVGVCAVFSQTPASADAVADALANYAAQGAGPFDAKTGERRWSDNFTDAETGQSVNCASCHRTDLRLTGQHIRTRKPIEPLAPAANPRRLTDIKKIETWFLRNCKGTWGRECTAQEKGDFLVFIRNQ